MRKRQLCLVASGSIAGVLAYRAASRAWHRARSAALPFQRPTMTSADQLLDLVRSYWRHPEALALLRNNPEVRGPLTDAVLAALLQGNAGGRPALADRALAWLSVHSEHIHGPRASETEAISEADQVMVATFAREFITRDGDPGAGTLGQLIDAFGSRTARDLVTYVRLVSGIVLVSNTIDALLSRFLGYPAAGSSLWDELKILAIWVFGVLPLVPVIFLRTWINPAG